MNKFYLNLKSNTVSSLKPSKAIRLLLMVLFFTFFWNLSNSQKCDRNSGIVSGNTRNAGVGGAAATVINKIIH